MNDWVLMACPCCGGHIKENMYKITVTGEAYTAYPYLSKLDNIACSEEFTEYSDLGLPISNGYCRFKYENGQLWTVTIYDSDRRLTQKELNLLKMETIAQWSDGIGENFEQQVAFYDKIGWRNEDNETEHEVYISMWDVNQHVTVTQKRRQVD